ncbi:MAG: YcjX family protein [Beijerinckiaceae bacterium]
MASGLTDLWRDTSLATRHALEKLGAWSGIATPTLRLGVTGLARAGKSVFITALVHALMRGEKLPVFEVAQSGRLRRATLQPHPNDAVPRFAVEDHLRALVDERQWPESTRRISQLRCAIEYEAAQGGGPRTLLLDIVDYPGEWLLDLGLIGTDYRSFAAEALAAARSPLRRDVSSDFLSAVDAVKAGAPYDHEQAEKLARIFREYLLACRREPLSLSTLPPGRFLMPGDLEGSPALSFAPIDMPAYAPPSGSMGAMMERLFDSYRDKVVGPFFRDHFSMLDRQIVLVDVVSALNAGPAAVADLEAALARVLLAFRAGRNSIVSSLFSPRIDRVMFAATKADHLHHTSHDRLEAILGLLVERAMRRAEATGADVSIAALASVRATREAGILERGATLPTVVGVPQGGQRVGERVFDGVAEAAIYTGELPADPRLALDSGAAVQFPKFRPPVIHRATDGRVPAIPHIRLDRAMQFLLGDYLA